MAGRGCSSGDGCWLDALLDAGAAAAACACASRWRRTKDQGVWWPGSREESGDR
jgi:hypothetical protein